MEISSGFLESNGLTALAVTMEVKMAGKSVNLMILVIRLVDDLEKDPRVSNR
jgi:hypothetical protein